MFSLPVFQIGSLRKALQVMRNENLRLKNAKMKVRANLRQVINIGESFHFPEMLFLLCPPHRLPVIIKDMFYLDVPLKKNNKSSTLC